MLSRSPSLARRAAIVFASIYAAILIAVLTLNAAASWADRGTGNLQGPALAIDHASAELMQANGRLALLKAGRFEKLAEKNPSMWLIAIKDGRSFTAGPVPIAAYRMVKQLQTVVGVVTFRLPGVAGPLGVVSLQRRDIAIGSILIAAGGVNPATLSTTESLDMLVNPGVFLMLGVIGIISLLAMLVAIPAFSRALRPITSEASAISPQRPGRRLNENKAPQELLPLVRGFNSALDRLEIELGRRKRFIADVAHELRTPLAVVSLRVDALDNGTGKEELRRGLNGLTHLVSQMLDLERLSLSSERRSEVDLISTTRDVVADLAPIAVKQGYELSLVAPNGPVIVTGDTHAISRAITNLIGNAIAHSGGAGQVTAMVKADRTIDVVDEGPGIPETLQASLFKPFFRGDTDAEGCGLGLHIASEIMRLHDGHLCLVPSQRGAVFRLIFPDPAAVF